MRETRINERKKKKDELAAGRQIVAIEGKGICDKRRKRECPETDRPKSTTRGHMVGFDSRNDG